MRTPRSRMDPVVKLLKIVVALVCVAYIAAVIGVRLMERSLVYQPGARAVSPPDPALALNQRLVRFHAADSTSLMGWIIPAVGAGPDAPWVLISHGNYGN